jgi:peptidoglycan/xylan/chitin deacetylase (PgdA/CDA1 family)
MRVPLLGRGARAWSRLRPHATILLYHRIARERHDPWGQCVAPEHFAQQMALLAEEAQVVPLARLPGAIGARRSSRPLVAITFDDGYLDNLVTAKPILERHGLPATVFLASGWLGCQRLFWWDELARLLLEPASLPATLALTIGGQDFRWQATDGSRRTLHDALWHRLWMLSDPRQQEALEQLAAWAGVPRPMANGVRPLTPDEALKLGEGDLITIGAHSETHPPLDRLEPAAKAREIAGSKVALERLFGREVEGFSFPHGAHDAETIRLVREAGFVRACDSTARVVAASDDPLALPRPVVGDWDGDTFARRVLGPWWT